MLENLIKMFKNGRYSWVKKGEVFLSHLLDDMVALPIAIYHLDKSGDHIDVENRVKEVLTYASACSMCLDSAKRNKLMPVCKSFCKDCFSGRAICKAHERIYDTWNCDKRNNPGYSRRSKFGRESANCLPWANIRKTRKRPTRRVERRKGWTRVLERKTGKVS